MMTISRTSAVLLLVLLAAGATAAEPKILFEETFSGELDKGWTWLREDAGKWRIEGGALAVTTDGGSMWKTLNNYKNLLMRAAPDPNAGFQVEVLLENEPKKQFEHGGIACRFDDDHYVCFNKEYLGKSELLLIAEAGAAPAGGIQTPYEPRAVWLRLTVAKGKVVGHYREAEEQPWKKMGEVALPKSEKKLEVGLVSGLGSDGRQAKFRRFRVSELPKETK